MNNISNIVLIDINDENFDICNKNFLKEKNNESYSIKIITTWLNEKQISYTYDSTTKFLLCETGIFIKLNSFVNIKIDTNSGILMGPYFCQSITSCINNEGFKFNNVNKYMTPEDLFYFIEKIIKNIN
mgnify:CR=1 FL=1